MFRRPPPAGLRTLMRIGDDLLAAATVDCARTFARAMQRLQPGFARAFFRFELSEPEGSFESRVSCQTGDGCLLIDAVRHRATYREIGGKGRELLACMNKSSGLFLLILEANFDYEFRFEWTDFERWPITKLNGASGIPVGV